jgi:hypothetical protein
MNSSGRVANVSCGITNHNCFDASKTTRKHENFFFVSIKNFYYFFLLFLETKMIFKDNSPFLLYRNDLLSQEHRKNQKALATHRELQLYKNRSER